MSEAGAGRRLRVAYVTTVSDFAQLILLHDLRRLRDRVDATVVCSDGPGVAALRAEGFRVVTVPIARKLAPLADVRALWRVWRLLRRERFDVVHSWVPKGGLIGMCAGAAAGVRVRIHACRGLLYTPQMAPWQRRLFRLTDRLTYALAQRTMFNSRADREFVVGEGLIPADRARYTGTGIDLGYFARSASVDAAGADVRAALGIAPDAPVVLTVGRFVADKGYPELLQAAAAVHRARPDVRFVWVAPLLTGETGTLSDDDIRAAGLADVVHRVPQQADVRPYYAAAALLVHASHREGVPRVLMEGAAMGVPIVATDIPGCREVVGDGETGRLVPVRAPAALAAAILEALADPAAAARRAAAAEADVRARFGQDAHSERIWSLYAELVGG